MQWITSRTHPYVKQLVKLRESTQSRRQSNTTLLDGIHLIQTYLATGKIPISLVISETGQKSSEIVALQDICKHQPETDIFLVTNTVFEKISTVKTPTGILANIAIPHTEHQETHIDSGPACCILLESIQDPGNLGTMIRTAATAGVTDVYLSAECVDAWSPRTLRAAMGAHFYLNIYSGCNLVETASNFQGQVLAALPHATHSLYQSDLTGPTAFIFGNEGAGLSKAMRHAADKQITIPMPGKTESLNAATAMAICLFEKVRQERYTRPSDY